uniref:B30.2/SPRY domain-containing protein n=1 Tax=Ciona intestinalis TaxID=7719 RepID=F6XTD6_CIOIN
MAKVILDEYISDLNLEVNEYNCSPLSYDGFSYMWAGAKANFGIRCGKVCFEVKISEYCDVTNKEFADTHVARVGWSTDNATLQLGEDKNSFGFGSTGKKSLHRKFTNYGRRYEKGDVVGCYLSMENGWVEISYSVNGRYCGVAFKVRWMTDEALFPHILTKNCRLDVNFGQSPHPYFSLQPGFKLIGHSPRDWLVGGVRAPVSQSDCEVIMMVGLPGVGKSTWALNYQKIHPSKKYFILGTDSIIDKMRVMGLPRKNNFGGRWDVLIKQASDCFNALLKKASELPRNLILDQTNVYSSARRRKVKLYREKGYNINAMVLVPRDNDMVRRSKQRTLEEGKEVPETAVLDMKANFSLPDPREGLFDKITYLELQEVDARELVEEYNIEAMQKGHRSNQQLGRGGNKNQTERNFSPTKSCKAGNFPNNKIRNPPNGNPGNFLNSNPGDFPNSTPGNSRNSNTGNYHNSNPGNFLNSNPGNFPKQQLQGISTTATPGITRNRNPGKFPQQQFTGFPQTATAGIPATATPGIPQQQNREFPQQQNQEFPQQHSRDFRRQQNWEFPQQQSGEFPQQQSRDFPKQ